MFEICLGHTTRPARVFQILLHVLLDYCVGRGPVLSPALNEQIVYKIIALERYKGFRLNETAQGSVDVGHTCGDHPTREYIRSEGWWYQCNKNTSTSNQPGSNRDSVDFASSRYSYVQNLISCLLCTHNRYSFYAHSFPKHKDCNIMFQGKK